jgi:tetratricopeptide (TPR) repeat protein
MAGSGTFINGCLVGVIVAVAAIVCFVNVLPNDFCDDGIPIVALNDKVNAPGQWVAIWTTDYWLEAKDAAPLRDLLYRPVALVSYRLVRVVAGIRPFPHHIVNIALHAIISVLIVRLCRHVGGSDRAALAAGLLFAVMPIHTAVLNNVVGRADLLATLGVLLALLSHRGLMRADSRARTAGWCVIAGFAVFIAMGSKESGVCVILLVPLFDALWHRGAKRPGNNGSWYWLRTLARLSYLAIPAGAYFALRYVALGGTLYQRPAVSKTINVLVDAPWWQHVLGVFQAWGMYWQKTLWPKTLCVNYSINEIRLATSPFDSHVILGVVVSLVLVLASALAWRRGNRSVALIVVAVALAYAPTANALVLIQVFFAERVWYLPSVWVALLLGLGLAPLLRRRIWRAFGVVIIISLTARCWARNTEWTNNGTLYAAAYRDHPDAIGARYLYGRWLAVHSDDPEELNAGIRLLESAIAIDLGFTDGYRALGVAYLRAGLEEAALASLATAESQVPGHPPTARALNELSAELAARDKDLAELLQDAERNPQDVDLQIALVRRLRKFWRLDEAVERLRKGETRFGHSAAWQLEYAVTLVHLNNRDAAVDRYRRCIELDADNPQLLVELAMLLLERREGDDLDEAWRLADRAATLAPRATSVLVCRAELHALRGDIARAVELYRQAIQTLPGDSEQRRSLEARARTLGQ